MKQWFKRIGLCVTVLGLCLSLCSCAQLDDMRSRHAVWAGDAVVLNGVRYQKLPYCRDLAVEAVSFVHSRVYVTDADVPVLLSEYYGTYGLLHTDENILEVASSYYCPQEQYDEWVDAINNYELDRVVYLSTWRNWEDSTYHQEQVALTAEAEQVLAEILAAGEVEDSEKRYDAWLNAGYSDSRRLYLGDESGRFLREYVRVMWNDASGECILVADDKTETALYEVSAEQAAALQVLRPAQTDMLYD